MKAMIFAAGLGTRLRPITDTMPKALVKVGGVPMLERVLRKLQSAGIGSFVVNTFHFAEQIESFLDRNGNFGAEVAVSRETGGPFETGGGIFHARKQLEGGRFLVHNVDILSDLDVQAFLKLDVPGSLATLLLTDSPADRYLLFDDDMRLAGWTNVRTGEVKSPYPDFYPSRYRRYSFCGIHILSDEVFPLMEEDGWPEKFSIIDFYLRHAAERPIYGVVADKLRLIDIGSPEKLAEAEASADLF